MVTRLNSTSRYGDYRYFGRWSFAFLCLVIVAFVVVGIDDSYDSQRTILARYSSPKIYKGVQYWKEGATQNVETLYETQFARFQLHKVLLEDGQTVITDWMWYDEGDNINVLVETPEGKYLVFYQNKYAIPEKTYAVVGGFIERGEQPQQAAARELKEEMGMISDDWWSLGDYVAASNRGGGSTYAFLARNARRIVSKEQLQRDNNYIADGESERQDVVEMTREELLAAFLAGKFKEVKWTATIGLALLRTQTINQQ